MSGVKLLTSLAQDCSTVNLIALSHPVQMTLICEDDSDSICIDQPMLSSSKMKIVTASVTREITGSCCDLEIVKERNSYNVVFNSEMLVTRTATRQLTRTISDLEIVNSHSVMKFGVDMKDFQKEDFTLDVLYRGKHVKGSPFLLRCVHPLALSSVYTENRSAVMDAGEPINLVVPLEKDGEIDVSVEGPFGRCKAELIHLTTSISAKFRPKGAGAYSVNIKINNKEIENSPFLILADFSAEEAQECHIMKEDQHLFKNPTKMKKGGVSFRVCTDNALLLPHHSHGEINVVCSGPAKVAINVTKDPDTSGIENCQVIPSMAGKYRLNILWNGYHIRGSPCMMQFVRQRRSKTVSIGLNLHELRYQIGVPYYFQLNCSDFNEEGEICAECYPLTAGEITVMPILETSTYQCQLLPLEVGMHTLSVICQDYHVAGSPFEVEFHDDASACRMIETSKRYESGGKVSVKISTKGTKPGLLEATVEDSDKTDIPVTIERLSDVLYQLDFCPRQSSVCHLTVMYNRWQIKGSPFKLVLSDPNNFKLHGEGLLGGRIGVENTFTLQVTDPPPGEFTVEVKHDDGQTCISSIKALSSLRDQFEAKYTPMFPGNYQIHARWGQISIPGSPFPIICSLTVFEVQDLTPKTEIGEELKFKVYLVNGDAMQSKSNLQITARDQSNNEVSSHMTLIDKELQIYACTVIPKTPGKHIVSVKWNNLNIRGSPFLIKAITPPRPDKVRVYGVGIEHGVLGERKSFIVETGEAGSGLLAIKVHGPSKDLKINTYQDQENNRKIHAEYLPLIPGEYTIRVKWGGVDVPGSPFRMNIFPPAVTNKVTVEAEIHPADVAVAVEEWNETLTANESLHMEPLDGINEERVENGGVTKLLEDKEKISLSDIELSPIEGHLVNHIALRIDSIESPDHAPPYHNQFGTNLIHQVSTESSMSDTLSLPQPKLNLPYQDSFESITSSLYDIIQTEMHSTDDEISIHLEDDLTL